MRAFLTEARTLQEKLGLILFQLPPKFAFKPDLAKAFCSLYRDLHSGPTVFEPRHPTWFTPEATHLLQQFHIARAATDPALVPEAAIPGAWSELIYYRLHGSPRMYYSGYTDLFLRSLAATLRENAVADTWCIFDNTALGEALGNALTLQHLLAIDPVRD